MTIDVEDYFHASAFNDVIPRHTWDGLESRVCANTHRLLEIFAEHEVFVLGWVAERYPALVKEIAGAGHEIASHGFGHRLIYEQTPNEFREDVRRAKRLLEDTSGATVAGYRAPSFSITARSLWALDVLIEEGHTYDSSIFPVRHDRYGIPDAPRHTHVITRPTGRLTESPAATTRIGAMNLPVGGGGYFRLMPYRWTRWGIRRVNRLESKPAVFYLHPWEIDPGQPRFDLGRVNGFRHYRNLRLTETRLRRLLRDFRFGSLSGVLSEGHPDTTAQ
jgi:polysaccharide deacetylase family protein (PEP-CTERM system associated)